MRRGTSSVLSCQSDDKGSPGGQGDASGDSKSAGEQETEVLQKIFGFIMLAFGIQLVLQGLVKLGIMTMKGF